MIPAIDSPSLSFPELTRVAAADQGALDQFRAALLSTLDELDLATGQDIEQARRVLCLTDGARRGRILKHLNSRLAGFRHLLVNAFLDDIVQRCGRRLLVQRRPLIRINIPGDSASVSDPHDDTMYGHAPGCWVVWVPMHAVDGAEDGGLYFLGSAASADLLSNYAFDRPLARLVDAVGRPPAMLVPYGSALIFRPDLVHGACLCQGDAARISIDIRVQSLAYPLFEKDMETYGYMELT